jgi:hypothetical protein
MMLMGGNKQVPKPPMANPWADTGSLERKEE